VKLFNVIVVYDCYVVAESDDAARAALLLHIREEKLPTSETNVLPATEPRHIRTAWQDERPLVASDVSDEDFERVKGKTTEAVRAMLHAKPSAK